MTWGKTYSTAAALILLTGCQGRYLPVDDAGHTTANPPSLTAPTPVPPAVAAADTCGASQFQYLIGKPKTEIPVPVDLSKRRVICSTCTVAMDVLPDRMDITFDTETGKVTSVSCG